VVIPTPKNDPGHFGKAAQVREVITLGLVGGAKKDIISLLKVTGHPADCAKQLGRIASKGCLARFLQSKNQTKFLASKLCCKVGFVTEPAHASNSS
jgi:hypothetical protein